MVLVEKSMVERLIALLPLNAGLVNVGSDLIQLLK
jgi:hypothetical protein